MDSSKPKRISLQIPNGLWNDMLEHARSAKPNECVGLLFGQADGLVRERFPLVNASASPTAFLSDARSMLEAEKRRRKTGWDWLAVYHSHPTSPPVPSRKDLAEHLSPAVVCLIISLMQKDPDVAGYWIENDSFESALISVISHEEEGNS